MNDTLHGNEIKAVCMIAQKKVFLSFITGVTFLIQPTLLEAQTFPDVYVFSEKDDAENTACSASQASAVAAVQAALRSNNIRVENSEKAYSYMQAYVTVNAIKLSNICAATFDLKLQNYQKVKDEYTQKDIFTTVLYCKKSSIVTGATSYIYTTMLDSYKDMTNQCISEYYEQISK